MNLKFTWCLDYVKVLVGLPTFNNGASGYTIRRTLEALANQSYRDFRVLVVYKPSPGDETVLSVVLDEFRRMFSDDVEFVVLSSNPERTVRIHGVRAIRERLTSPVFWRFFLRSHMLAFAGGGRYGYATWRRMALLALSAKLLGKAVIFGPWAFIHMIGGASPSYPGSQCPLGG